MEFDEEKTLLDEEQEEALENAQKNAEIQAQAAAVRDVGNGDRNPSQSDRRGGSGGDNGDRNTSE